MSGVLLCDTFEEQTSFGRARIGLCQTSNRIGINLGIFSLFGKKNSQPDRSAADAADSRAKRAAGAASQAACRSLENSTFQRDVARATSIKIDAIESEMSDEFVNSDQLTNRSATSVVRPPIAAMREEAMIASLPASSPGVATGFLLGGESWSGVEVVTDDNTQIIDEAAILYANNQNEIVEHMLQDAIGRDNLGNATSSVWWLLLDLYQVTGNRESFENLSVEYASKFETSPPAWKETLPEDGQHMTGRPSATPVVIFAGKLDASIARQLERIQKLSVSHAALRLEFARVTSVDPVGCGLVLRMLQRVRKAGLDLVLVGAPELAHQIRLILQVGRRNETEAPWLLLLELLQLLQMENEFEETSIDYCVTFEVSPPSFTALDNNVTMEAGETAPIDLPFGHFAMPAVVEGKIDHLVSAISDHAALHQPAILDCSGLLRVEFGAAGQLLNALAPLCANGRQLEFHEVNHLIAALFRVMGMNDIVRVVPRKN